MAASKQEIPIADLFHDAWAAFYVLINKGDATPEQILHAGMFFGWFSRLLKQSSASAKQPLTLESASAELAAMAESLDIDLPGDAGYVERLRAIAKFLADSTWMEKV